MISFAKSSFGTTWGVLGDLLGTIWRLLEDDLGTTWGLIGDLLGTTWGRLGDYLGTIWGFLGRDLGDKLFFCFFQSFLYLFGCFGCQYILILCGFFPQWQTLRKTRLDITVVEISKKCVEVSEQIFWRVWQIYRRDWRWLDIWIKISAEKLNI